MLSEKQKMKLDLNNESDLFLLFALASAWSKTGQWENAAYFVTYLKLSQKSKVDFWLNDLNIEKEINDREYTALNTVKTCTGITPRRKVSFRKDYYSSLKVLASHWDEILTSLKSSEENLDYMIFIDYISNLNGLGAGNNRMRIKIPLILRELRCQKIYKNIPGAFCCVPDERVKIASKNIGIKIPHINSIASLFKASKIIYNHFGNLYDIPLFAYEDLKDKLIG